MNIYNLSDMDVPMRDIGDRMNRLIGCCSWLTQITSEIPLQEYSTHTIYLVPLHVLQTVTLQSTIVLCALRSIINFRSEMIDPNRSI
jgi:hypothetical protein